MLIGIGARNALAWSTIWRMRLRELETPKMIHAASLEVEPLARLVYRVCGWDWESGLSTGASLPWLTRLYVLFYGRLPLL